MFAAKKWAAKWRSQNRLDGYTEHFLHEYPPCKCDNMTPKIFKTRREAREWIEREYGYIRKRPDLQAEPFGWMVPQAVRVHVEILEIES